MTNKNELYLETTPYTVNLKAMDGEEKCFDIKSAAANFNLAVVLSSGLKYALIILIILILMIIG